MSYQSQEDTLVAELVDRSKELVKDFPKEFRQLSPDYSLDVQKDCKLDKSKLKGKEAPFSCRLREDGEFIDISLENSSDLLEPYFIIFSPS